MSARRLSCLFASFLPLLWAGWTSAAVERATKPIPGDLTKMEPADLVRLASELDTAGEPAKKYRLALSQRIAAAFFGDPVTVRRLSVNQWNSLYVSLRDVAVIDQWAPPIWQAYAGRPSAAILDVFDPAIGEKALRSILPYIAR